jgi:hypothetical protein
VVTAFRRSGYLFFLAFAFRLQMWISGWTQPWTDVLRVDILNSMGFAVAVLSVMAFFRTAQRARWCAVLGLAIAALSPVISEWNGAGVPAIVRSYLVPDGNAFGFFPWGAFLVFGLSAGSIIRSTREESIERAMQWGAVLGGILIFAAQYFSNLPFSIYSHSDFWLNSPGLILIKLGVTLLLLAGAFVWTRYGAGNGWSWVRQFGTTSLLVYWVHIELVYGRWFWFFKESLTVAQTVLAALCVILLMLTLSTAKTNRARIAAALPDIGWWFAPKPERVSGD